MRFAVAALQPSRIGAVSILDEVADFVRYRACENQFGGDGFSGSYNGVVSEGRVFLNSAEVPFDVSAEMSIVTPLAHAEERCPARFTVTKTSLRAST